VAFSCVPTRGSTHTEHAHTYKSRNLSILSTKVGSDKQ
jgi:hypothetical protein